jgi:ATP-dependent DNA helicase RecQ
MYFHSSSFQGIEAERATIDELLRNFIYPALHTLNPDQLRLVQIPFRDSDKQKREKAIYRLSIVGVVKDYTVDYRAKRFEVWIVRKQETDYLEQLQAYVGRFKTQEYKASVPQQVHQQNGRNLTEKCIGFLVKFVYDEIEKKRRTAIKTMAEVARMCHTDGDLRTAINNYFELSPFTQQLRELASRIEPQMWWNVLDRVEDIETAQQLLGGSRRTIESYTDHPGLLFLSGLAKFFLPNQSEETALGDIRAGIRNLKRQVPESQQEEIVIQLVEQCRQRFGDVQTRKIAGTVLAELPTRLVARSVYLIAPIEAENVLLNLTLHDVRDFSQHFLRSSAHA